MRGPLLRSAVALCLMTLGGAGPNGSDVPPDNAIVITGQRMPIVVNGKAIHCRPLADDPQDSWTPTNFQIQRPRQSVLVPRPRGQGFGLVDENGEVGGLGIWRRAGFRIDQYVFRAPSERPLLCIGSKTSNARGYARLRLTVRAAPFIGKRLRFTGWVASRDAQFVGFWLWAFNPRASWREIRPGSFGYKFTSDAAKEGIVYNGSNSENTKFRWAGSHGWTPVLIEIGPISHFATLVSFSFILAGSGDAWLYNPKLEIAEPDDPFLGKGDVFVVGTEQKALQSGE